VGDSGPQGIAVRIVDIHGADLATGILGSVDISAASLAALEQITVTLDAASLAALESITAVGPLTDTQLRASSVPVTPAATESHLGQVGGTLVNVAAGELTRPADTTAYAAKDVISDSTSAPTVLTFTGVARASGGSGYITKARIMTDLKTWTGRMRLHLFDTSPTAINDNSPFLLLYANKATRIGVIDFTTAATEDATNSTGAEVINDLVRLPYVTTGGANIFGILEVLEAATPASGQKFYVQLTCDQN
jgi:hypothetical protein